MRDVSDCTRGRSGFGNRRSWQTCLVSLSDDLTAIAHSAGASAVGIARAEPFDDSLTQLKASIDEGLAGPLGFTYERPELAADITRSISWARSLIVFGVSYVDSALSPPQKGPVIARFATGDHYEAVRGVAAAISALLEARGARSETLIDDNHFVDRAAAVRAGIGWLGRSTMVLAPGRGPWMLLGNVATDAALDPSSPMKRGCGTCTACIPACPTGAILDGVLDARRCLSTWLQTPGSIPLWVRPVLGRRIYGCDDCLTSCPPGQTVLRSSDQSPTPYSFEELLARENEALVGMFDWWFVPRRDGRYIRRNLLVAAGNSGESSLFDLLTQHLRHQSSMIRGHAAWAAARTGSERAGNAIRKALQNERTPEGREEMLLALLMLERPGVYSDVLAADELATSDSRYRSLALLGLDLQEDDLPDGDIEFLLLEDRNPPDVEVSRLAGLIRVNDRDRVAERLRRDALLALASVD